MSEVEVDSISSEQPTHEWSETGKAWSKEEVDVVGHQCPGKTFGAGLDKKLG